MLADDLKELEKVIFGQLVRFLDSQTIAGIEHPSYSRTAYSAGLKQLVIQIPANTNVRDRWKATQVAPTPDGIILCDGSVVTTRITIREIPELWKPGNLKSLYEIITLHNRNGHCWAYISSYNYSFYPNTTQEKASELGYFRYDFHPEMMGNGDLGGHPYFHLHHHFSDEEAEPEDEIRFVTGLVNLSDILSMCEQKLFPDKRAGRLSEYVKQGNFDGLALDLSPSGFQHLLEEKFTPRQWRTYEHRKSCESFIKKRGWNPEILKTLTEAPEKVRSKKRKCK
jgi:hypothetical protein